jgi:hypothetical protein
MTTFALQRLVRARSGYPRKGENPLLDTPEEALAERLAAFAAAGLRDVLDPRPAADQFIALTFGVALSRVGSANAVEDTRVQPLLIEGVRTFLRFNCLAARWEQRPELHGALLPVRDRHVGASSRNCRFSANAQVVLAAETRMLIAAAQPLPGTTADAHAWRASGLAEQCEGLTLIVFNVVALHPAARTTGAGPPARQRNEPATPEPRFTHVNWGSGRSR